MASKGESSQIHQNMEAEDNIPREKVNSTLKVLKQSPLVSHRKPKQNRRE